MRDPINLGSSTGTIKNKNNGQIIPMLFKNKFPMMDLDKLTLSLCNKLHKLLMRICLMPIKCT